jgi:hypothetical protein
MPRRPNDLTLGEAAGNFALGAGLGVLVAITLIVTDGKRVLDLIESASAPKTTTAILIGVFAAVFGVGATLTGLIFSAMDRER